MVGEIEGISNVNVVKMKTHIRQGRKQFMNVKHVCTCSGTNVRTLLSATIMLYSVDGPHCPAIGEHPWVCVIRNQVHDGCSASTDERLVDDLQMSRI